MNKNEIIQNMKLYLFDMDGTLYLGSRLYDFTIELLQEIRRTGGKYLFITNNSSKSVADYVKKLAGFGIEATRDDFMTSSQATAYYLHKYHEGQRLYVCGTESLKEELRGEGFTVTTNIDEVDCIVMGFDTELTFQKLEDACILLGRGVDFLATNPDWVCPTSYGSVPDCGSVCEMLFRATGRRPKFIGKPEPDMALLAVERTGFTKEQTLLIGDRVYTDIACGVNAGVDTAFVLSGEGVVEDIEKFGVTPTAVFPHIRDILAQM